VGSLVAVATIGVEVVGFLLVEVAGFMLVAVGDAASAEALLGAASLVGDPPTSVAAEQVSRAMAQSRVKRRAAW
jgi:hypothetical protein